MWCGSDCSSPLIMTQFILLNRRVLTTSWGNQIKSTLPPRGSKRNLSKLLSSQWDWFLLRHFQRSLRTKNMSSFPLQWLSLDLSFKSWPGEYWLLIPWSWRQKSNSTNQALIRKLEFPLPKSTLFPRQRSDWFRFLLDGGLQSLSYPTERNERYDTNLSTKRIDVLLLL